MDVKRIIAEVDAEIAKLTQIRASLAGMSETLVSAATGRRGRPKGSKNVAKQAATKAPAQAKKTTKRKLSPEGRKRIAEAMKRRWAERRKETGK